MTMTRAYWPVKDFLLGTYFTLFERINRDYPHLNPREFHEERHRRENIQKKWGLTEAYGLFGVHLIAGMDGNGLEAVIAVALLADGLSRFYSHCGFIPNVIRSRATHHVPEDYFVGKW